MIFCLSVVSLFFFIASLTSSQMIKDRIITFMFIASLLIITFKEPLTDSNLSDLEMYKDFFNENGHIEGIEYSFTLIKNIVKSLGFGFMTFLFVYGFISTYFKYKAINLYSSNVMLSLLLFYSYFFMLHGLIQIRAGVASGLLMFSLGAIYDRKLLKFLIIVAAAVFFHVSSVLMLPLYFLNPYKINIKLCVIALLIGLSFAVLAIDISSIVSMIPEGMIKYKVQGYLLYSDRDIFNLSECFGTLLRLPIIIFLLMKVSLLESKSKYVYLLLKIYIYGFLLFCSFVNVVPMISGRLFEFFQVLEILLFPLLIFCFPKKKYGYMLIYVITVTLFCTKNLSLMAL